MLWSVREKQKEDEDDSNFLLRRGLTVIKKEGW